MPTTKSEPTPGPELDKKREYIVKELQATEQTYVKSLEDALNVHPFLILLSDSSLQLHLELLTSYHIEWVLE